MQHGKKGRTFHRKTGPRRSFLRSLSHALVEQGSITTTEIRAKAIRPLVEKWVTLAKKQTLASRRLLLSRVQRKPLVEKLMHELAPRYAKRTGGYLRIVRLGVTRKRDGVRQATISFVS
jgi:large subunit ribosomal protein L17